MLGQRRLDHCAMTVMAVVCDRIPGHVIETGVWRGGASMLTAKTLELLGEATQRKVYFCDSFKGIPKVEGNAVSEQDEVAWTFTILNNNSVENVKEKSRLFGVDQSHIVYVQGYFNESLPALVKKEPTITFSVIRLDGDTYFSTMDAITVLYPRLNKGGFIIIDDFVDWVGCQRAVDDYRRANKITEPITIVPHKEGETARGAYWRKGVTNAEMPYCVGAYKIPYPNGAYTPSKHVWMSSEMKEIHQDFRKALANSKLKICV